MSEIEGHISASEKRREVFKTLLKQIAGKVSGGATIGEVRSSVFKYMSPVTKDRGITAGQLTSDEFSNAIYQDSPLTEYYPDERNMTFVANNFPGGDITDLDHWLDRRFTK